MINYDIIIGIEVHVNINSKAKMFSYAPNSHNQKPNTQVDLLDIAILGILPTVNMEVINKSIILADSLNMEIFYNNIAFDRKHYIYYDLPKGYQITQQYHPIGRNGSIILSNNKKITIERIHIEEDTAKQITKNNIKYLDYNRSGMPLIEIVSDPCINSASEASEYLNELKKILVFKDISDAKLEDGSMRADINISLKKKDTDILGTKVEIKNINSFNNVIKAIGYEISRQSEILDNNELIIQETRRYDDNKSTTVSMRNKTDVIGYSYCPEPNIPIISLEEKYVLDLINNSKKSVQLIEQELKDLNFSKSNIDLLMNDFNLYSLFIRFNDSKIVDKINLFNFVTNEISGNLNKAKINWKSLSENQINDLIELIKLLQSNKINIKEAKSFNKLIITDNEELKNLIQKNKTNNVFTKEDIEKILINYFNDNNKLVLEYKERPERVSKFFIGMVMKETKAQADPKIVLEIFNEKIKNFFEQKS